MSEPVVLGKDDVLRLEAFHRLHFPNQPIPKLQPAAKANQTLPTARHDETDADLGQYEDGVKRTLTDEQIAMFRYSEVQRIIQQRAKAAEQAEQVKEEQNQKYRQQTDATAKRHGHKSWDRHFDEAPTTVDTLMYDEDEPGQSQISLPGKKQFLWPTLGR